MTIATQIKQTLASIKGARATLDIYAEKSSPQETREVFGQASAALQEIVQGLEKRVQQMEFEEPQFQGF